MANNNISFKPSKSQLDGVISGATLDNGVLILSRTQGLINVEVNLSGLTGSSGSLNTFNNGLTDNGGTVSLGGTLTGNTVIDTGGNGIAFGSNSIASGYNSFAEGRYTTASGTFSHAEGFSTIASGIDSHAEGLCTTASGSYSHAEGSNTTACGFNSHAEGVFTTACGNYSHAEGRCTLASGIDSHAEGFSTTASGFVSHAEGNSTTSSGNNSHAEGNRTTASGNASHSEGLCTIASGYYSHAEGRGAIASGYGSHAGGYGNLSYNILAEGCASFNHSTNSGSQILGHGAIADQSVILGGINHNIEAGNTNAAIIGGDTIKLTGTDYIDTTAVSKLAIMSTPSAGVSSDTILVRDASTGIIKQIAQSELTGSGGSSNTFNNGLTDNGGIVSLGGTLTGDTVINTNSYGIAFGCGSVASGQSSHAEGRYTTAGGNYSHSEGRSTIASGGSSHAEGRSTTASGFNSHAEGRSTTASGFNSHAEGRSTTASGFNSHAEGHCTTACGGGSHAEGRSTTASGNYSHAEGYGTIACGFVSHTGGYGNLSRNIFAEGRASFNHSYNSGSQISGHGALADQSVILGGINHNIEAGNTNATIIGGDTIKLTGTTYVDTTAVGNLAIFNTPANGDASTTVMVRDSGTGIIQERSQADVASASDERLKNIIQPITGVLEGLSLLNSYEFQFNDKMKPESLKGKTRYGLIAQELEKVFPHVVENDYKIGDEIYKSVRYTELIPILVKANQELHKILKDQDKRIAQLEDKHI